MLDKLNYLRTEFTYRYEYSNFGKSQRFIRLWTKIRKIDKCDGIIVE